MICIMYITCYNIFLHFVLCMIIINSCDSLQGNHPRVRRRNKPAMWEPRSYHEISGNEPPVDVVIFTTKLEMEIGPQQHGISLWIPNL